MTLVDRATRCIVSHAVCRQRTPEVMQSVIDSAPHATRYFSDAFNTYKELCWWGTHQAMYDKSQTYAVEAVNADLRHYLARRGRRSRCFSRCLHALRRAVGLFVHFYNERQLRKRKFPHYPAPLTGALSTQL